MQYTSFVCIALMNIFESSERKVLWWAFLKWKSSARPWRFVLSNNQRMCNTQIHKNRNHNMKWQQILSLYRLVTQTFPDFQFLPNIHYTANNGAFCDVRTNKLRDQGARKEVQAMRSHIEKQACRALKRLCLKEKRICRFTLSSI